eukprot:TRINITY_DN1914_c0_g1_i1.p1 TRINITY_DN1914_c0_g1~~TRINITY_DN1914_c0_g1_i1.p1  ORF type:complete len:165 (-),score=28.77 TRINITY_DN1914_c0_g1_i1:99-593(-)
MQAKNENFRISRKRNTTMSPTSSSRHKKAVEKALKSPELREKGTEFINAKLGIASAPKKAVGASAIGVDDYKKVDFETQLWKEDLIFWIREATYLQQAGFFLNAYWSECGETAEAVWEYARSMVKFDTKNGRRWDFLRSERRQFVLERKRNRFQHDRGATDERN